MKEIRTEIQIDAAPEKVWATISKLNKWGDWNPIVNDIKGAFELGAVLSITMSDKKGNDAKRYDAKITELEPSKRFTFVGVMMAKFLFSAERIIELKPIDTGTLFSQREVYTGLMVSMFWNKMECEAKAMLISMNEALKAKVEGV